MATGVDELVASGFRVLVGRRVGLITNHTGRAGDGGSLVDVLITAGTFDLVALFSPEHGFAGKLEGKVADSAHASGLPVHSLYGKTRKPTAAMLSGLDCLVFDIQDIGTRFYTYVSTMGLAMEAAAAHGLRFVVLDRPNPINGVAVGGPVLDAGKESFVGYHRIPVRHGMTVGELARMFVSERPELAGLDLVVVPCRGWRRSMFFDETGLLWTNPSPNMRTLTEALLYPGVGLLETTNLSVGRGTDTPFEVVGAPWIDGRRLAAHLNARRLPGIRFYPVEFRPSASKFRGESCGGIHMIVTDRRRLQSVAVGIHLACALRDLFGEQWDTTRYGRLLGDAGTLAALRRGAPAQVILERWRAELRAFARRRQKALLYPGPK